jgi:hypothetical protein
MNGKKDNFLITLLSSLLLISCLLAGFFAWKTQKLVSELRVATNILKPTPIATSTPTPDPTANWKTYVNTKYNFSLKYPNEWRVDSMSQGTMGTGYTGATGLDNFLQISLSGKIEPSLSVNIKASTTPIEKEIERNLKTMNASNNPDYKNIKQYQEELNDTRILILESDRDEFHTKVNYFNSIDKKYLISIEQFDNVNQIHKETLDQILSTFKFTDPDTTCTSLPECAYNTDPKKPTCKIGEKPFEGGVWCPRPTETPIQTTACTMEAKICPDGSAVGRSGPKCEFTACPTPKY